MSDRTRVLAVQRMVILALLLLFLAALVGLVVAGIADPSAVFIPAILAGLVGVPGLAVLLGAYGRRHATPIDPSVAGGAVRRATTARAILLVGAIAVTGLGVALGVAVGDGSLALVLSTIGISYRLGPQCMKITGPRPPRRYAVAVGPIQRRAGIRRTAFSIRATVCIIARSMTPVGLVLPPPICPTCLASRSRTVVMRSRHWSTNGARSASTNVDTR